MMTDLHFTDTGDRAITLVFLHYFGGSSNTWKKVIAELSDSYRCVAIDLPGFGDSSNNISKLSVSECAIAVAKVIRALALKKYVLVGHSMGGKIALSLASLQPFGLASLILAAPSPPTGEPMSDGERRELLNAYGDRIALEKLLKKASANMLSNNDLEKTVTDNLRASYTSWKWWTEDGSREDISDQMQRVRVPLLIISAALDSHLPTSFLRREMIKYFPSASFAEIANAAHLIPIEVPLSTAKLIQEFLEK